jgi:hypothetical protein
MGGNPGRVEHQLVSSGARTHEDTALWPTMTLPLRRVPPLRSPERSPGRLAASCGASKPALTHLNTTVLAFSTARRLSN